jgi:hypothetical protein
MPDGGSSTLSSVFDFGRCYAMIRCTYDVIQDHACACVHACMLLVPILAKACMQVYTNDDDDRIYGFVGLLLFLIPYTVIKKACSFTRAL